jgi:hypothetical protein
MQWFIRGKISRSIANFTLVAGNRKRHRFPPIALAALPPEYSGRMAALGR